MESMPTIRMLTPAARPDAPAVIAVHGITANGVTWAPLAAELVMRHRTGIRFLAPDLRGRGASHQAPGPFGLARHADDLAALAAANTVDGVAPVLVGHSMGAFVVALAVARDPGIASGLVLVDGGFAFPAPPDLDVDAALQAVIGPAMDRLSMRFTDEASYLDFWAEHPAIGHLVRAQDGLGEAVRGYLLADLLPTAEGDYRSSCVLAAVRADGADILTDPATAAAARRVVEAGVPTEFLWAPRGLRDEPQGLYDDARLAALALPDALAVTLVPDVNHYTVLLSRDGVTAIADAVDRLLPGAAPAGARAIPGQTPAATPPGTDAAARRTR